MATDADATPPPPKPDEYFATTHWTVVLTAGQGTAREAEAALGQLCAAYWYPLYAYVRRQGTAHQDAEDLVQGFFARFLERNYLAELSSERGKFRAFLLASLKHFLANEWDKRSAQKRGGAITHLGLDWAGAASRYGIEPVDQLSPDKLYDRAWAITLLERVLDHLRRENEDKLAWFEQTKGFLMVGKGAIPYAEVAAALGMSEGAVRVAVHRLRKRYRELLRAEIAETLSAPQQIDEEMRALLAAFAH